MRTTCLLLVPVLASTTTCTAETSRPETGTVFEKLVGSSGMPACSRSTVTLGETVLSPCTGAVKSAYAFNFVSQPAGPVKLTVHGVLGQLASAFVTTQPSATRGVRT